MVVEAAAPGVALAAEGGLRLAPALTPQSPPGHAPVHHVPAPTAALAPTHNPGPGVDPGHLVVTLAPGLDPAHIHPPSDGVAQNLGAPPLLPQQCWAQLLQNYLQTPG